MKRWITLTFLGVAMISRIGAVQSSLINENCMISNMSKVTPSHAIPSVTLPEELKERVRLASARKSAENRPESSEDSPNSSPFTLPKKTEVSLREFEKDEYFFEKLI